MRTSVLFAAVCLYTSSVLAQQCPTPGPTNWCSGLYQYDGMGNIKFIGADAYTYDALGRLVTGTADVQRSSVPSRQTYTYDPFGNRTDVSRDDHSVGCVGGCEIALTVSQITNHITSNGALYDEAGNLHIIQATTGNTTYPTTYTYDGAGSLVRAVASDDRQFIYTADDERIATKNGVTWTWTLRGADNKVLREYTSMETNGLPTAALQWDKDYVFRDGLLLASAAPITPGSSTTVVQHYHLDHLGTPRVVTTAAGAVIGIHAYYPFGAELDLTPKESNTELLKFTGHERDVLPVGPLTLDAMHARYEMGALGRFLSVDAHPGRPAQPQSWNRYAYTMNNPIIAIDPDGLDTFIVVYGNGAVNPQAVGMDHDVGRQFAIAARTRADEIRASGRLQKGDEVLLMSASNINEFTAITNRQYSTGKIADLEVFSHAWADPSPGGLNLGGYGDRGVRPDSLSLIDKSNFTKDATVTLWGCNAGRKPIGGDKAFAQAMADALGVSVSAHTGPADFNNQGQGHPPMIPSNPRRGKMQIFRPAGACIEGQGVCW